MTHEKSMANNRLQRICNTLRMLQTVEPQRCAKEIMKKERNEFICLFKTGKLYELDMVGDALQKQRIPFFKQVETSSGLRFAMPFQPSMGPGTWYVILVPENAFGDAKKILEDLPIEVSTNPDIWHFGTSDRVKSGWRFYVWIVLGLTFFSLVIYLYELLK